MNCKKCHADKDETDFAWMSKAKGTRHSACKECKRNYNTKHYSNNKKVYIARAKNSSERNRRFLFLYLLSHPCVECGETNPILLEFAHKSGSGKESNLSQAAQVKYSLLRIQTEIAKCRVLCVRCHRLETAREQGWFADLIAENAPIV
jgi:hypothetical protein